MVHDRRANALEAGVVLAATLAACGHGETQAQHHADMANALRGATNGDLDAAGLASLTDALDRHFSSTALESAKVGASAGNLYERNFATLGTQADALQLTEKQIAFGGQNSNNFEHQK